jgi:uncharacterized protein
VLAGVRIVRNSRFLVFAILAVISASLSASAVQAHAKRFVDEHSSLRDRINDSIVTVLSGNRDGDSLGIVYDLSEVLDDGDNLRVLPVVGKGSAQNITDVLLLRGIDMGITNSNLLNHYAKTGELGDIKNRLTYIAKLFNEEMHVVAGNNINELTDLNGKSVNFGEVGSGTQVTAELVFQALNIHVNEVNMAQPDAINAIKDGRIAASILITGKPSSFIKTLSRADGLKLVPIAFTAPLVNDYYPAELDHADYPNLIADNERVDTVANCAVIIAFNWPQNSDRYAKVAKFVDAFFDHFDDFRKAPRRKKWMDVNFAATLEGWQRFPAAQDWIDAAKSKETTEKVFAGFVAKHGDSDKVQTDAQREALFRAFLKWKEAHAQ